MSHDELACPSEFVLLLKGRTLADEEVFGDLFGEDDLDSLVFESKRPMAVTIVGFGGGPRETRTLPACQIVAEMLEEIIIKDFTYSPAVVGISNLREALAPGTNEVACFGLRRNKVCLDLDSSRRRS